MSKHCERCKEKDEYQDYDYTNRHDKYFFKIMVGDFRAKSTIPDEFVQHIRGKLARNITLESRNGRTFDVQVTKKLDRLVLQSGWNKFASSHDLKMGDFLVFKYDGITRLKVLIFDHSGCEKASSCLINKNTSNHSKEWREEYVDISSSSTDLPVKSLQSESLLESWVERDSSSQGIEIVNISSSSSPSESSGDDLIKEHPVPSYILPRYTSLTDVQTKKLKEKVRAIHSEIPVYVCIIRKSHIDSSLPAVDFCRKYTEAHLKFNDRTLTLERHGKKWAVHCKLHKNKLTQRLLKGWRRFALDNKLQLGDICLFELLKSKYAMNVHIIHKK